MLTEQSSHSFVFRDVVVHTLCLSMQSETAVTYPQATECMPQTAPADAGAFHRAKDISSPVDNVFRIKVMVGSTVRGPSRRQGLWSTRLPTQKALVNDQGLSGFVF
jgi:hypothetical protein